MCVAAGHSTVYAADTHTCVLTYVCADLLYGCAGVVTCMSVLS